MDELRQWEATEILRNLEYVDKTERDLMRAQLYVAAQSNSKKKLDPAKDVYPLPWDKRESEKFNEQKDQALTKESKRMEDLLNNGLLNKEDNQEQKFIDFLNKKIPH